MTAEVQTILSRQGQTAIDQIKQNMSGINATGKTAQSLRYEVTEEGSKLIFRIIGKPYFKIVETGRKPTPQYTHPSKTFVDQIKEWIAAKGQTQSAAYAIAKSIHQKGTKLWRAGGRTDVFSNVLNESFIDKLSNELLTQFAKEYLDSVIKSLDGNNNNS